MKTLLFAFFGIAQLLIKAQNGFTTYTSSMHVSGPVIRTTSMLVDNSGNKWIGLNIPASTNVALAKYDNTNWTYYSTSSTPAMPSNNVTALAKDNSGNIWIGTNVGLVKFTGTNFVTFDVTDGLPSNTVTCIETVGSMVYIGTASGLSRFDGLNFTNYNMANGKLPSDLITSVKAENANLIWLGGNSRLVKFNINSAFTVTSYNDNPIAPAVGKINCIYIDAQNKKWLGTTTVGVLIYSGLAFVNAGDVYPMFGGGVSNAVYDICEGLNNGVATKMIKNALGITSVGIIELAPNNKVYQYFYPSSNILGDYIEKDGLNLAVTQVQTTMPTLMFYEFDKTNYAPQLGDVNNNNFKTLDINNVNAGIANRGDMHWDIGGYSGYQIAAGIYNNVERYEVPKGSGRHSNLTSALWIGGLDNANQLHGAAQTYRQTGNDFWPGPLDTISGGTTSAVAINYDKIWKVNYTDINDFITNFNSGNVQNNTYTPGEDLVTWPAKGTGNYSRNLAPFVDVNGNGIYDPLTGGDYPKIKGDEALYYIFNDNMTHSNSSCNAMGIEVQAMAYAYGCPGVLNGKPELSYTTFYDYKIINRSADNYHNVYVGMWSEVDIGYYDDDYIGCNVSGNYGYGYNADNNDQSSGAFIGYANYPPAQGFAIVKGPLAVSADGMDNDNDGIIDEVGEECKLNKFTVFSNNYAGTLPPTTDPQTCTEYQGYLTGKWRDGTNFTCGGNAYGGTVTTNWVYPGDPVNSTSTDPANTCGYWTEISAGNTPNDRRLILGSGPFNINAGQMQEVEYAFVTSFDSSSTTNGNILSVGKLKNDIARINEFYNHPGKQQCSFDVGIKQTAKPDIFLVYPNPAKSVITVKSSREGDGKTDYEVVDILGELILKNESNETNFTVNISDLTSGIYFLRLKVNNSFIVKKFVKE